MKYVVDRWQYLHRFLAEENPTVRSGDARDEVRNLTTPFYIRDGKVVRVSPTQRVPGSSYLTFEYTPAPRMKITEVHYHPAEDTDLEFVEICNLEEEAVNLSGWNLPAIGYVFPEGSTVPARSVFLVARDPEKLRSHHGKKIAVPVFGPYPGNLSNSGEHLRFRDSGRYRGKQYYPETIDAVKYDDVAPWPRAADGDGASLELLNAGLDNDYAHHWRASARKGGSPGEAPPKETARPVPASFQEASLLLEGALENDIEIIPPARYPRAL
jgi:hypothetical protein